MLFLAKHVTKTHVHAGAEAAAVVEYASGHAVIQQSMLCALQSVACTELHTGNVLYSKRCQQQATCSAWRNNHVPCCQLLSVRIGVAIAMM